MVHMVHGRPRLTIPPFQEYGHAWLELNYGTPSAIVFDVVSELSVEAERYYRVGKIDRSKVIAYTAERTREMIELHEHWGPWE